MIRREREMHVYRYQHMVTMTIAACQNCIVWFALPVIVYDIGALPVILENECWLWTRNLRTVAIAAEYLYELQHKVQIMILQIEQQLGLSWSDIRVNDETREWQDKKNLPPSWWWLYDRVLMFFLVIFMIVL